MKKKSEDLLWARKLREKYIAGEHLLPIQISMASEVLNEHWENGQCRNRSPDEQ